jgi:pimeloyl-ACP methyl ester carboxylesterase
LENLLKERIVVFLPGIFSAASFVFAGAANFLRTNGCQTVFIEYPHKGKTIRQWPDWRITKVTLAQVLDRCRENLDKIFLENQNAIIYLVGHSSGGMIALYLASTLARKDRISGVVAINPAPLEGIKPVPLNRERLLSFWPGLISEMFQKIGINLPVYRSFRGARRVALPKELPQSDLKRIWKQMRWESLPFLQALSGRNGHKPPAVNFQDIAGKVRIIGCRKDKLVPLEVVKEYNAKIPGSECCVLDTAHYPFWADAGFKLNNLLLDFVS